MMHLFGKLNWRVRVVAIAAMFGWATNQQDGRAAAGTKIWNVTSIAAQGEPAYMGKSLSYWLKSIRDRDSEMEEAFDAIRALGPEARMAVPQLTEIVAEPFTPIEIGVDKRDLVLSKLSDIALRADAIDALAAIGEAAASSSETLIQWALTIKVVPKDIAGAKDRERFIDLVAVDVLERMRVAGAVAQFGRGAIPAIVMLLASPDDEGRKLAVAMLDEKALPMAAALLKSQDCEERETGIAILADMWPVVARDHLITLENALACDRKSLTNTNKPGQRRLR